MIPIDLPQEELRELLLKALNDTRSPLQDGYGVYQAPLNSRARVFTGETQVKIGDAITITYDPIQKSGYIDVEGVEGADMKALKAQFDKVRGVLPEGLWGLNPGDAKNAAGETVGRKHLKHLLYKRWFKNDPQVTLNADEGLRNRPGGSIEGFTLDTRSAEPLEGSRLFRDAEKWLTDNPGKTLKDYRKETGYDGPALKTRQKKGEPIRVSFKGKSTDAQAKRVRENPFKTEEEARYVRNMQKKARELSKDPIHEIVYGGRSSVAEHNLRGDHEIMSISDPDFAAYKTELENKALKKGYLVGVDNISGELVLAPKDSFNKYDPSSSPGARLVSDGTDIATIIGKLPTKAEAVGNIVTNNPITRTLGIGNDARLANTLETMADLSKGIPPGARFGLSLLPGLGIVGDTADAAVKLAEAQAPDATWLDKAQAAVAGTVATTSVIPEPTAQTYNFVVGLGLGASDLVEHYGERAMSSIYRWLGKDTNTERGSTTYLEQFNDQFDRSPEIPSETTF